jgi:hypothetical protein
MTVSCTFPTEILCEEKHVDVVLLVSCHTPEVCLAAEETESRGFPQWQTEWANEWMNVDFLAYCSYFYKDRQSRGMFSVSLSP